MIRLFIINKKYKDFYNNKVKKIIKNVNCISKKTLLEENKLNKLMELKRGLMQDMFV